MPPALFALGVPLAMAADLAMSTMLRRTRPQPFGMSSPSVTPALLSSAAYEGKTRRVSNVVLCYGRPLRTAGQLIEVETWTAERMGLMPAPDDLPTLEETITRTELRDEAWARHDWMNDYTPVFSPDLPVQVPADGFERRERTVVVAGQERRMLVITHGHCDALRFVHDSMVITAVARLGFPESPHFDVVDDLEPYLAEHRRFILSWLRIWQK